MSISTRNKNKISSRGATLVEACIALPVLLIVLMGVVDLGFAIDQYLTLSRAAYEATRYGGKVSSEFGATSVAEARVKRLLEIKKIRNPNVIMKETLIDDSDTNTRYIKIEAEVTADFHGLLPLFNFIPLKSRSSFMSLFSDRQIVVASSPS